MIAYLDTLDKQLLLALNNEYSLFWDGVMYTFSGKLIWIPLYLSIVILLIKRWKKEALWLILALAVTVALADFISSGLIKEWVMRPRPSRDPVIADQVVLVNGYRSGKFGFVSSHAANSLSLALFSALIFRNRLFTLFIFLWAAINSYSRIYLGVHYPGDILGGFLVGLLAVALVYYPLRKYKPALLKSSKSSNRDVLLPLLVFLATLTGILIYSELFFV